MKRKRASPARATRGSTGPVVKISGVESTLAFQWQLATVELAVLSLRSATRPDWITQVAPALDELLIDHAHCERKAAGVAMNLLSTYVECEPLVLAMGEIVVEELDHLRQVLDRLRARGVRFRKIPPSS